MPCPGQPPPSRAFLQSPSSSWEINPSFQQPWIFRTPGTQGKAPLSCRIEELGQRAQSGRRAGTRGHLKPGPRLMKLTAVPLEAHRPSNLCCQEEYFHRALPHSDSWQEVLYCQFASNSLLAPAATRRNQAPPPWTARYHIPGPVLQLLPVFSHLILTATLSHRYSNHSILDGETEA